MGIIVPNNKIRLMILGGALGVVSATASYAQVSEAEFKKLQQRVQELEKEQTASVQKPGSGMGLVLSGLVEVEYSASDDYEGEYSSDIALATVELGIDAELSDKVSAHVLLLHEDDDTESVEVDEAILSISHKNFLLNAGRMYVPFGQFETNMVSDTLALELGETRESAVELGYGAGPFSSSVYLFNGDSSNDSGNKSEQFGFRVALAEELGGFSYDAGIDYISSLADSGMLQDGAVNQVDNLEDYVAGYALHASVVKGAGNLFFEYLSAADSFDNNELAFNNHGAQPAAMNIEAGYQVDLFGKETQLALAYQLTEEAVALELPESRLSAAASFDLVEHVALGIEFSFDKDYDESDGGTGDNQTGFVVQLATEF